MLVTFSCGLFAYLKSTKKIKKTTKPFLLLEITFSFVSLSTVLNTP